MLVDRECIYQVNRKLDPFPICTKFRNYCGCLGYTFLCESSLSEGEKRLAKPLSIESDEELFLYERNAGTLKTVEVWYDIGNSIELEGGKMKKIRKLTAEEKKAWIANEDSLWEFIQFRFEEGDIEIEDDKEEEEEEDTKK